MTNIELLRRLNPGESLSAEDVFGAVFEAGSGLSEGERELEEPLEIAIRLLEARRNQQIPEKCFSAVEMLAEECGLYPYIDPDNFNLLTQTIIQAHSVSLREKVYLHVKQMQVLLWLLQGDSVVLSAPTSFGKSLLVDAFISYKRPRTVVVILPTIALLDETRRRYRRTFQNDYSIITTVTEPYRSD